MKNIFKKIYNANYLNKEESFQLFQEIIIGNIKDIELSSILTAMHIRGENFIEIEGAVHAFLKNMKKFPKPSYIFSDITGTGGDNNNTINISTTSAFVAAACGFKIIKHCNQGMSSQFGSADLLKKFNINIYASTKKLYMCLEKLNICFLFAPKYHNGFQNIITVRKTLKIKTIFNILGPLLNPSYPPLIVIGVYQKKFVYPMAKMLSQLNYQRAIVLHGNNTDEVTLNGITYVSELLHGKIISYELIPEDFGILPHSSKNIIKSSLIENYNIISKIFQGKGETLYEELIAVNVAILLKLFGYENLKKNTEFALKKIRSGDIYNYITCVSNFLKED